MIAGNLIVNGAARCLNTLYANNLNVSGTTSFASLAVTGTSTFTGKATFNGHVAVGYNNTSSNGTFSTSGLYSNGWLRSVGGVGWYSESYGGGIWMKNSYAVRVYGGKNFFVENGDFYIGGASDNPTNDANLFYFKKDGTLKASTFTGTKITVNNLQVTDTLRSFKWDIDHVANLGGTFLVTPTYIASSTATFTPTSINTSTGVIQATINDGSISGDTMGGVTWAAQSKIKITGKVNNVTIPTCDGKLTNILASGVMRVEFTCPTDIVNSFTANTIYKASEGKLSDLTVMLTTVGATNPVGIYMTARDGSNYSHISLYGGTATTPTVRIGNLQGLPAVNNVNPSGWGIYTNHGYFDGVIVSQSGKIGNWYIGTSSIYSASQNFGAANNMYFGTSGISLGTAFKVTAAGALTSTSATVTGEINASSGSITGGLTVSGYLTTNASRTTYNAAVTGITISGSGIGGWGSTNAYFNMTTGGVLTAKGATIETGTIGGWTLTSTALYNPTNHSAWNTANAGIFIGTTTIAGGNGGTWYLKNDGTGKIGRWSFASNGDFTTTVSGNTAGMGNASYAFWAGAASSSAASAPFRVAYDGSAVFTNATLGDPNGYHTYIDSDSLDIKNGTDSVASFGQTSQIWATIPSDPTNGGSESTRKVVAEFGTSITVGATDRSHLTISSSGFFIYDIFTNKYFDIGETGGSNYGLTEIKEYFYGETDPGTAPLADPWYHYLNHKPVSNMPITVKINGTVTTAYTKNNTNGYIVFNSEPYETDLIEVTYTTSDVITYYTLGSRSSSSVSDLGERSFIVGKDNSATGRFAFGGGINSSAPGYATIAYGEGLIANRKTQAVFGRYNLLQTDGPEYDTGNGARAYNGQTWLSGGNSKMYKLLVVGNGTDDNNRGDAFSVNGYGDGVFAGSLLVGNSATIHNSSGGDAFIRLSRASNDRWEIINNDGDLIFENTIYYGGSPATTRPIIIEPNTSTVNATFTGTLILSKTTDASANADNGPALVVGGTRTQAHMEIDANEIQAKSGATGGAHFYLNYEGGNIYLGSSTVINATSKDIELTSGSFLVKTKNKGIYLTDKNGNLYGGIYDNANNLCIGHTAGANYHHAGGTYISTGWNGTDGNETIYVSVPHSNSTSGGNTLNTYGVWHKGNLAVKDISSEVTLTKSTNCNSVTLNKAYRFGALVYINFTVVPNSGLSAGASVDITYDGPSPWRGSDSRIGYGVYSNNCYACWWYSNTVIRCRLLTSSAWANSQTVIFTGWYFAAGA